MRYWNANLKDEIANHENIRNLENEEIRKTEFSISEIEEKMEESVDSSSKLKEILSKYITENENLKKLNQRVRNH